MVKMNSEHRRLIEVAIALSRQGMERNNGGPFGAVVVRDGQIIGRGWNQVTSTNDPTAHAEIVAIREACAYLKSPWIDGCDLYTSCEPCPMCLGAIYWAHMRAVYYANTRRDAAAIGFDDEFIYTEFLRPLSERRYQLIRLEIASAILPFEEWQTKSDKIRY